MPRMVQLIEEESSGQQGLAEPTESRVGWLQAAVGAMQHFRKRRSWCPHTDRVNALKATEFYPEKWSKR